MKQREIKTVEKKWLQVLYKYLQDIFSKVHIPSHDETHHLRVWQNACAILKSFNQSGINFKKDFIEKLIMAVFFHDAGMIESIDQQHGIISRQLAFKFFNEHEISPLEYQDVLLAIEKHDDKTYRNQQSILSHDDLYSISTIADDMDALGALGIYRYLEIYEMRGIDQSTVIPLVLKNLNSRINHMKIKLEHHKVLLNEQITNYNLGRQIILSFNQTHIDIIYRNLRARFPLKRFISELDKFNITEINLWIEKMREGLKKKVLKTLIISELTVPCV